MLVECSHQRRSEWSCVQRSDLTWWENGAISGNQVLTDQPTPARDQLLITLVYPMFHQCGRSIGILFLILKYGPNCSLRWWGNLTLPTWPLLQVDQQQTLLWKTPSDFSLHGSWNVTTDLFQWNRPIFVKSTTQSAIIWQCLVTTTMQSGRMQARWVREVSPRHRLAVTYDNNDW